MAFDTAEKRFSLIAFGDGDQMLFEPDATVDLDDMQHLLGCYSGIAFSSGGGFQQAWAVNANVLVNQ